MARVVYGNIRFAEDADETSADSRRVRAPYRCGLFLLGGVRAPFLKRPREQREINVVYRYIDVAEERRNWTWLVQECAAAALLHNYVQLRIRVFVLSDRTGIAW